MRKLHENIRFFRDGLRRIGLYVTPIVFPAMPQNAPRIPCRVTAALSKADLTLAPGVIEKTWGLIIASCQAGRDQ